MKEIILPELKEIKEKTDFMINYKEVIENKDIEKYLKSLEKIRYEMFNKIKISNKENPNDQINFINNLYKATVINDVLKIYIPEALPKFKNINNYAYKNILLSTAECIKDYEGLFKDKLTFVVIIVHEKQSNMDIDNKYVKPIIDALVLQKIIQDDNIQNMFYLAQGKNDTTKPYTDVFVMDGKYITGWLENIEKMF